MIRWLTRQTRSALALALLAAAVAVQAQEQEQEQVSQPPTADLPALALMGTIPVYWGEADEFADLLNGGGASHWARPQLEAHYRLQPLDSLSADALAPFTRLLMAQPRTLSPAENVALDGWVRGGGRLLLLADPLMTGESRFGIGDRRRPQDAALLSPILGHWGLDLAFDDSAAPILTSADAGGIAVPVNLPGRLTAREGGDCTVVGRDSLAARCRLGAGEVLVIADAALLDHAGPYPGAPEAFESLLARAFGDFGEIVHEPLIESEEGCKINVLMCGHHNGPDPGGGEALPS
jgi:hypothetical protein